ncbi:NAD-dependent epimerase/dehydratase family protein [Ekhidna sp.]|uniref:NAD-dependent epimerase/dehydratase family protein n=1 Tax=Ekhidna sp. TaxID=2608089 RepID=UPI003B5CD70C
MNVIITGATGMVGKGVLLECLDHPEVEKVLSIGRSEVELNHPKLVQLIHKDFSDFSSVRDQLKGYDAAYLCMGVSAAGMSEEKYHHLTYDLTLALAKPLHEMNPNMTCTYVSGLGTDSTEKGRTMWARVKGKTENALLNLGFRQAFMFRPGGIIPKRGIKPSSKLYRRALFWLGWLLPIIKAIAPNSIVNTSQVGLAMINVTKNGYDTTIIHPRDILKIAG